MFPATGGAREVKVDNEIGEAAARIVEEHPEFTLQQINNEMRLGCRTNLSFACRHYARLSNVSLSPQRPWRIFLWIETAMTSRCRGS